jgi:hypothetical protein
MLNGWTFFDQVMLFVLGLSLIVATWSYLYTHPRKKQK